MVETPVELTTSGLHLHRTCCTGVLLDRIVDSRTDIRELYGDS